jgi:hypothetical protein
LLAVGLAGVPALAGLAPSPWWEWLGAGAGMLAGRLLGARAAGHISRPAE